MNKIYLKKKTQNGQKRPTKKYKIIRKIKIADNKSILKMKQKHFADTQNESTV
jgi:hypothetical protein